MEAEKWLPVKGFEPRFKISNHGRLLSIGGNKRGEVLLKPHTNADGYFWACLKMAPKRRSTCVHVLVAEAFCHKPESDIQLVVNHIDGNKKNNNCSNLEWVTQAENIHHAIRTGLRSSIGESNPNSKLSVTDVLEIKRLVKTNTLRQVDIANLFSISKSMVGNIERGEAWKSI